MRLHLILPMCLVLFPAAPRAGEKPKSVVFKSVTVPAPSFLRRDNDITSDLWRGFQLLREANAGVAAAQHELGLRFLLGEGVTADTAAGAEWIGKAAAQKHAVACYNFGVLLNNGIGVPWNPFQAYREFQFAASKEIVQAKYMLGVFLSDDLALPRDIPAAYWHFRAAADSGFEAAREVLAAFAERGWVPAPDSAGQRPAALVPDTLTLAAPPGAILDTIAVGEVPDSIPPPALEKLRREAARNTPVSADGPLDPALVAEMRRAADWGSPEALTFLGRCAELGTTLERDSIIAAGYYLQAMRLGAPYAPLLLYRLIRSGRYLERLKEEAERKNPAAEYCWAALFAFGFGPPLTEAQALQFLESAAARSNTDALLALAACYHSGTWVRSDHEKERELLRRASETGSRAARLQMVVSGITESSHDAGGEASLAFLREASDSGSVLAQQVLGYCHETGVLTGESRQLAVRYYRLAAQRGNAAAYEALRRMYDSLRPAEKEFALPR